MRNSGRFSVRAAVWLLLPAAVPGVRAQWTAPTPEELSMTSIPEVPGAPAVYLYKEEISIDGQHMQSFYVRLKVLTEGGKEYANVELPFASGAAGRTLDSIAGRTIHADGTILPFTGKPYEKVVEKMQGYSIKVKIFSLPSVEVGSIIEYRYKLHLDDSYFSEPDWIVQTDLFTRKAHYMWQPTDRILTSADGKQTSESAAWWPNLPNGVEVKQRELAQTLNSARDGGHAEVSLDVHDIPPIPKEEFMPPMQSLSYKVLFYYTSYKSPKEYWTAEGKTWSKNINKFVGPGSGVTAAVTAMAAEGDTQDQKLRKLYAAVMALENTDFTRERSTSEERGEGLKEIKTTDDVLSRKRGSSDQLTELFVAMARAAGMKAYVMGVADRNVRFFVDAYLNMHQLNSEVAIVNVDGKETFFDPGQRYCSYGHLSWKHALTGGLRQVDGGTVLSNTPGLSYKENHVSRIADLRLDDQGIASGIVTMTYTGDSALSWRHDALRGDATSLNNSLRTRMEHTLPGGMEVKVESIENLTDSEKPLKVIYSVKGAIGSSTGKRLLVPADLFETNSKPRFPEPKRELPVDMHYPSQTQDAVRLIYPDSLAVESAPTPAQTQMTGAAAFDVTTKTAPNSITIYRNVTVGKTMFGAANYSDLRDFYSKLEAKDQETLVLTRASAVATKTGGN